MTVTNSYDALLLDLDGTLLDKSSQIRPRNLAALQTLVERGVQVMIATGRSTVAAMQVIDELSLRTPVLVFNGAALYCTQERKLLEERILSNTVMARAMEFGAERELLTVVQQAQRKFAVAPRTHDEERALEFFHGMEVVERDQLPTEYVIRVIYYSAQHVSSKELREDVQQRLAAPLFLTDFPLNLLVSHRDSPLSVVDVHPPSKGKAEGLRYLQEKLGIDPQRVVAIGDASNDVDMLRAAGLGVAMGGSSPQVQACADRVIGDHDSDAIADLLEELFEI
jgi:Cof subfamily protein (haloacid dehalogenase superfamily)